MARQTLPLNLSLTVAASTLPWDAEFISQSVPAVIEADQVFAATITMKNTGVQSWTQSTAGGGGATRLWSQSPDGNQNWGTAFIILGQGKTITTGQSFAFTSNLRAPSVPGTYTFQFQLKNGVGPLFGQPSAPVTVTVVPSTQPPYVPPAIPAVDEDGRVALQPSDLQYLGSTLLPSAVGPARANYSFPGMTLRKMGDGSKRLVLSYNYPTQWTFDTPLPTTLKPFVGVSTGMPVLSVVQQYGSLVQPSTLVPGITQIGANGSIYWDEVTQRLLWTHYDGYWTGGPIPILAATQFNDDGTTTPAGQWLGPTSHPQKWFWGGVTRLPQSFAAKYTSGKTLALGFGGYWNIAASCSRGPAASAFALPAPGDTQLSGEVNLMGFADPQACQRSGDYFVANIGYWNTQPRTMADGSWTSLDFIRAMLVVHFPDKQGIIMYPQLGVGRLGYDYASQIAAQIVRERFFFDSRARGQPIPYVRQRDPLLNIPTTTYINSIVSAACIDEETRTVYELQTQCYKVGTEFGPVIHVYRVG